MLFGVISMTTGSSDLVGVVTFTTFEEFEMGEAVETASGETILPLRALFHLLFGFDRAPHPIKAISQNAFPLHDSRAADKSS